MTHNDIIEEIFRLSDSVELASVMQAAQLRKSQLATRLKFSISVGDAVKFTSARARSAYTYTGKLTSKRQTRATVMITGPSFGKYPVGSMVTVPFTMLERVV